MSRTKFWIARAALAGMLGVFAVPAARGGTGDVALDGLIAERIALIADEMAADPDSPPESLQQSAALLDLARELSPTESRFARSSVDLLLRMGERDRAIDALSALRKLDPADQVTMIQYIDLVSSKMETAEQKLAYLKQVVDAKGVAAEVQSHACTQLMDLYYARAQDAEANEALEFALKLNPQNMEALKAKYRIAAASGVAKDRVKALADLIRASPGDADAMNAMAREADDVGSYESSGVLRLVALQIHTSRGVAPSIDEAINFIGTQLLAGNDPQVSSTLALLLQSLKDDGRIYTFALLYEQMKGERTQADQRENVDMSRGVYLAQLAGVSQLLNEPDKTEMPATRPAVPMPNVRADVAKLKAEDSRNLTMAYAVALTEQLWFDLYWKAAEVDDANIEALGQLLGETDPIVVRLQGWKLLQAGKAEEARLKLEAVADRDGFAKLGVIVADRTLGNAEKAREALMQMIHDRPTGMIAGYVASLARSMNVTADQTATEQEIGDIISNMRSFVMSVLDNPRGYYLLTAQPSKVSYSLGEPMLATVTILNNGRVPITVCPGGTIDPLFVIDAQVRSTPPQGFPATTRGKFTGAIRLKPSQKITQTVRIDRGNLYGFLRQYPTPLFPMTAFVITNAVPDGEMSFKAGAGGQQSKLGRAFERQSSPLYTEEFRNNALAKLANGTAGERTAMAELFGYLITPLKQQADNPEAQTVSKALEEALKAQIENETNLEIKSWMQLSFPVSGSKEENALTLAKSNTILGQVGAMLQARAMAKETRAAVAQAVLDSNPESAIAECARALATQPDLKVKTAEGDPTTAPAQ